MYLADDPATWPEQHVGHTVPWSGELVPLEIPGEPPAIPLAGPVITFVGQGVKATWDDVWGWVRGTAQSAASDVISIVNTEIQAAVKVTEAYTGAAIQALSGFINDAFDFVEATASNIADFAVYEVGAIEGQIVSIDEDIFKLLDEVAGIEGKLIPAILGDIGRLGIDTFNLIGDAIHSVETWAIDNIYVPVLDELVKVDTQIRTDVWDLVGSVTGHVEDLIASEAATRAAEIAALGAAVAALTLEAETCVTEMCATQGPNTDLGKLFKALSLAGDAALLVELGKLTEPQLVALIESVLGKVAGLVGDFESYFQSGTETFGSLVTNAIGG